MGLPWQRTLDPLEARSRGNEMVWIKAKIPWIRAITALAINGGLALDWQQQGIVALLGIVGPFVYGALATFFALLVPLLLWELWPTNRRAALFGELSEEILGLRNLANTATVGSDVYPALSTLNAKLEKLEIQIPHLNLVEMNQRMALVMLLSTLGGYAETTNLRAAKNIDMSTYLANQTNVDG